MTKADMVDIISNGTGLTKVDTEAVIDAFLLTLSRSMVEGRRVEFRKFGSFGVKKRAPKQARNPGTGEAVNLPSRYVPVFKPSRLLRERVNAALMARE
jgi:nucleoid DNA-binding protein